MERVVVIYLKCNLMVFHLFNSDLMLFPVVVKDQKCLLDGFLLLVTGDLLCNLGKILLLCVVIFIVINDF